MKQLECMIAWTSPDDEYFTDTAGKIEIGPWPDKTGWSDRYCYTTGACEMSLHEASADGRIMQLFLDFNAIVVRDGINPQEVHKAFLKIDEYRQHIAPDMDGATVVENGLERLWAA
jgi:hypothetical protein